MKCTNCKYAVLQDTGYSNWTVMGVDVRCLKDENPNGTFDLWYEEASEDDYAVNCEFYTQGDPAHFDVDGEIDPESEFCGDDELIQLWKNL